MIDSRIAYWKSITWKNVLLFSAIQEWEIMTDVVQRYSATSWANSITWYYPCGIGFVICQIQETQTQRGLTKFLEKHLRDHIIYEGQIPFVEPGAWEWNLRYNWDHTKMEVPRVRNFCWKKNVVKPKKKKCWRYWVVHLSQEKDHVHFWWQGHRDQTAYAFWSSDNATTFFKCLTGSCIIQWFPC